MSKPRRWPWERHLPDPAPGNTLQDSQRRLAQAEGQLVEGQDQLQDATRQAKRANTFIRGLGNILEDNHIGPAVEITFRKHHGRTP